MAVSSSGAVSLTLAAQSDAHTGLKRVWAVLLFLIALNKMNMLRAGLRFSPVSCRYVAFKHGHVQQLQLCVLFTLIRSAVHFWT